ncbi:hypothetical protein JRQ81_018652 [Phrynocephalus forsythii]|uniref:Uncharacterized protein n=1 Tax=Phrynocephalus forsythii TaxID=171643 RepID=A0A9Q0XQ03_9SAUR|nr:hypothetical protein JRQ81_018652 [Phrynocephalus forsythii]
MMAFSIAVLILVSIMAFASSDSVIHYTSSGGVCTDSCGYHGYGYTWCKSSGNKASWDYCSLEEGIDASGQECASSCDFFGGSYRYCYLKNGKWNYCGLLGHQDFVEYSQQNHLCFEHCQAHGGSFKCKTPHGSERCSPFHDVTPAGLPCHQDYRCSRYGYSMYRCHIDSSEFGWDYCGRKSLDGCEWFFSESNSSQVEICTRSDFSKEGRIIFRRERRDSMHVPNKEDFKHAVHLIDKITSTQSFPDPLETMYFYKQEDISCKDIDYTSVELHLDVPDNTVLPIAHVVFPTSLNSAPILRLAFYTSLHSNFYQPAYTIAVSVDEPMLCSTDHQ